MRDSQSRLGYSLTLDTLFGFRGQASNYGYEYERKELEKMKFYSEFF
jgi:hypothetical protein